MASEVFKLYTNNLPESNAGSRGHHFRSWIRPRRKYHMEVSEEVGIVTSSLEYRLLNIKTSTTGSSLLIFCAGPIVRWDEVEWAFKPNREVSEVAVATFETELGFSLHTEALRQYALNPV